MVLKIKDAEKIARTRYPMYEIIKSYSGTYGGESLCGFDMKSPFGDTCLAIVFEDGEVSIVTGVIAEALYRDVLK